MSRNSHNQISQHTDDTNNKGKHTITDSTRKAWQTVNKPQTKEKQSNQFILPHQGDHNTRGWSGVAKVSCILRHRGIQLILAYSWARLAIFVAGKGWWECFFFFCFFPFCHSCSSFFPVLLFHLLYYFFYLFSPFLWETTQNDQHVVKPTSINHDHNARQDPQKQQDIEQDKHKKVFSDQP